MSESDNITRNLLGKLLRTEVSIIRSYRAFLMLLPIHGSSSYQSGSPLLQRRLFGDGFGTMTDNAFEVETRPGSFLVPRSLGKEISWDNFLWLLSMVTLTLFENMTVTMLTSVFTMLGKKLLYCMAGKTFIIRQKFSSYALSV